MEHYITKTNRNPDKEETMVLYWSWPKETHWINRAVGTSLEPPGGSKMQPSQKDLEEDGQGEAMEVGKTRNKGKRVDKIW